MSEKATAAYSYTSRSNGFGPHGPEDEFEKFKSEIIPNRPNFKLLDSNGILKDASGKKGHGEVQRFYEYKEETHPSGTYDRKDLHSVEQYTIPPKNVETSQYTYEQKQLRDVKNMSSNTYHHQTTTSPSPAYSKSLEMSKELSQSVKELDTLLDDIQRDRERHTTYKSGYVSDNAERTYDYRRETSGTPILRTAPSSGYSTLKSAEMVESYNATRVERPPPPPPVTTQKEVTREMWREEHHESRAVPSQISPAIPKTVPPVYYQKPVTPTPMNKVTTTVKTYTYEVPADQDVTTVPIPGVTSSTTEKSAYMAENTTSTRSIPPSPVPVRHYNDNTRMTTKEYHAEEHVERRTPVPTRYQTYTDSSKQLSNERILQNQTTVLPNGIEPTVPGTYKWKETTYSAYDQTVLSGGVPPPAPVPAIQQPPKKLDDLMADFPDSRFPVEEKERKVEVIHEKAATKNISGPPVYYPPEQKVKQSAAYEMKEGGGKWAKGSYEYEAQAKEKSKHKSSKREYPVCLPLCCAMPCTIM